VAIFLFAESVYLKKEKKKTISNIRKLQDN